MTVHTPLFTQMRSFQRPARLFLLATVIDGITYSSWSLFFNYYMLGRGFDREFLGLVTTVNSSAALLLGIPLGMLSDRIGRKRAMLLGVFIYSAASALQITVQQPAFILVCGFMVGVGNSLYFLSHAPFMMKASDENNRTLLFSLNFGLITLSGAVGSLFAGQLPALFGDYLNVAPTSYQAYQAVLLVSVILGSMSLIPLSMLPGRREQTSNAPASVTVHKPALWRVISKKITIQLALPNLLIGLGAAILIPYINLFFRDTFEIPDKTLGVLYGLSALLTGLGVLIGPRLAINLGSKIRAVVVTQGLSLAFLLVMGFIPIFWVAAVAFLLRGALMNMAVPLYSAFAMERVGESEQATVNSVKEMAWTVGWVVGPIFSGYIQQRSGFTPLFVITAILYAGAIFLTQLFFKHSEQSVVNVDLEGAT